MPNSLAKTCALLSAVAGLCGCDDNQRSEPQDTQSTGPSVVGPTSGPDASPSDGPLPDAAVAPVPREPSSAQDRDGGVARADTGSVTVVPVPTSIPVDQSPAQPAQPPLGPQPTTPAQLPTEEPPTAPNTKPYASIGSGGGGTLSGHLYALGSANSIGSTDDTLLLACFINETADGCDSARSSSLRVPLGTGALATYRFDGLPDGRYILDAVRDVNGNGAVDAGDELDSFAMNGVVATVLRPPVENVNLRLKPATRDATSEPALQLADLVGSWKVSAPDAPTHNYAIYADGQYTSIYAGGSAIGGCGIAASRSEAGTVRVADGIIWFYDVNVAGFSGGTCTADADVGAGTRVYAAQLWKDEVGRPAMILRAARGRYVEEELFIRH